MSDVAICLRVIAPDFSKVLCVFLSSFAAFRILHFQPAFNHCIKLNGGAINITELPW
jgi:hypothetical protein